MDHADQSLLGHVVGVGAVEMHDQAKTAQPLSQVPYAELCPGDKALQALQSFYR